jgi:hypothetical protein
VGGGNGGGVDSASAACRVGGRGGGAVQLVSLCGKIVLNDIIDASGGSGGAASDPTCPQGAGGGAGGTVWLQAPSITFKQDVASINVYGGGGGGGSCRPNGTSAWSPGSRGDRQSPGQGANCGSGILGGDGGLGGTEETPGAGGQGAAAGGEATCGGGGGARGRVVLDVAGHKDCGQVPFYGTCGLPP